MAIKKIVVNDKILDADEIVLNFYHSNHIQMFRKNKYLYKKPLFIKLNNLSQGLQFYISINFYFKKKLSPLKNVIYTHL